MTGDSSKLRKFNTQHTKLQHKACLVDTAFYVFFLVILVVQGFFSLRKHHSTLQSFEEWSKYIIVKLYLSLLYFSFFISKRERHYNHSVPHHQKLFKHLEVTYSQVWYIIGIVSSSPTDFLSEKIGLIRVTNYLLCQC